MIENNETLVTDEQSVKEYDDVTAKMIIEAVLFAAGYPITYNKLAKVLYMTPQKVREIVESMENSYGKDSDRGIMLLVHDDSAQLCTKEQFAPQIKEVLGIKRGGNLSASSLEVLATVAYNQPVTRTYVDTVRGVDSAYAMNSLTEKGLIEICGRLDAPGRPMLYRTTDDFLRCFGLSSLDDLPEINLRDRDSVDGVQQTMQIPEMPDGEETEKTE